MQSNTALRSLLHRFRQESGITYSGFALPSLSAKEGQAYSSNVMTERSEEVIALVYPDGSVAHLDLQQA
jgi:hypothetical protein